MEPLFLQGLIFSALVIGGLGLIGWWLFVSRLDGSLSTVAAHNNVVVATSILSSRLSILIGISSLLLCIGGYWDLSEHVATGIVPGGEDFLWPPHLMIYTSFLLAFLVALGGMIALAVPNLKAGVRDPRVWARRNPYIAVTALLAGYGWLSIPSDAIWHELYGIDTPWSPPHIFLAVAAMSLPISGIGLIGRVQGRGRLAEWANFLKLGYIALAMNILLIIAVIEWEVVVDHIELVANRPIWVFPLITGVISFSALVLAQRVAPGPWSATITTLIYFGMRGVEISPEPPDHRSPAQVYIHFLTRRTVFGPGLSTDKSERDRRQMAPRADRGRRVYSWVYPCGARDDQRSPETRDGSGDLL